MTMTIDTNESIATAMEEATRPPDGTGISTDNIENSSAATTEPETSVDNEARSRREPKECSCFPLGYYVAIPGLLATFGWFSRLSQDGCDFARLTGPTVAELTNDPSVPYLEVGFNQYREPTKGDDGAWYISYTAGCEDYNTDIVSIDGAWTFAKIAGFVSLVLGGAGALFLWFASCFKYSKTTWRWAGYELVVATILQLLTYSWFGTSMCHGGGDRCALAYGSKADILTLVLWLVSSASIFVRFPSRYEYNTRQNTTSPAVPTELEMAQHSAETQQQQPPPSQMSISTADNRQDIPEIS